MILNVVGFPFTTNGFIKQLYKQKTSDQSFFT